jgi:signal transduction histidine kinase/ActR/RegA family two-component response regulator
MAHYNLMDGAGIRDPGVVSYPIIILIGGLLFGRRAIPIFTFTGIISLIAVVALDASFEADLDRLVIISILLFAGTGAAQAGLGNKENNIKRLKESEENLREALEQARKHAQRINDIIETVPEGVLLLNERHQVILVNRTAQDFLAVLAPGHLREVPLDQLGPLERVGQLLINELIRNGDDGWQEIVLDQPERIFEVTVRQVGNVPPPHKNWVLVLRDATLERKQQETLQEQDRLVMVGQLASGIAHDFRNILSVILAYSQIMQRRPQSQKRKEYFVIIQDQVKDAVRLIEQILDFGRRTIMQRKAYDAVVLIEDVITILKRTMPSNIAIEFIQEPGEYVLRIDKSRIHQALLNLALNARDAMPEGGTLTFSLTKDDLPDELMFDTSLTDQGWVTLRISDTGEGIRPENLAHIFDPFFTTKEADKGTGLGLAQVYGIVKQHEGEITVESEPGIGTTFKLYLPAVSEKPIFSVALAQAEVIIGREVTVLLVEDNPTTRQSIEETLNMLGCKVVTADNGRKALELYAAQADTIDLVLSDIVMPSMGGLELYRELQKISPDLKFLVITGYPLNEQARQLLEQGLIDWIQKPFLAEELAEKIGHMAGRPMESI